MSDEPHPTSWKTTPKGATEEMIAAGEDAVRQIFPYMNTILVRRIVETVWTAAWRVSPAPPKSEESADGRTA